MADTVAKTLLEQNITVSFSLQRECLLEDVKREGYSERESHLERVLPVERCGVLYLGLILCSV
ncbi:hypothetical protein MAR_016574, partial [Mya arenaria]